MILKTPKEISLYSPNTQCAPYTCDHHLIRSDHCQITSLSVIGLVLYNPFFVSNSEQQVYILMRQHKDTKTRHLTVSGWHIATGGCWYWWEWQLELTHASDKARWSSLFIPNTVCIQLVLLWQTSCFVLFKDCSLSSHRRNVSLSARIASSENKISQLALRF